MLPDGRVSGSITVKALCDLPDQDTRELAMVSVRVSMGYVAEVLGERGAKLGSLGPWLV